jgi:hypothetical protein
VWTVWSEAVLTETSVRGEDYIYAQLEVSIRAAKDHQAMQDLHTMLGEFARVRSPS